MAQTQDNSKSKLYEVLKRGKLIVGTGSTNPPWHFEDRSGKLVGMDIDLARLIAKSLFDDYDKVEFVIQGSDARIPSLVTNKVDVVVQWMTITPGRAQQVEFTIPYYREGVGVMLMANGKYKQFSELKAAGKGIKIGAMQNVFIEEWVKKGLPEASVDQFDSPDSVLQALNARRIDGYLADQSAMRWLMQQFPNRYTDAGYGWMPNSYASAVRPGDPIWLNWVNTVYKEAMMGSISTTSPPPTRSGSASSCRRRRSGSRRNSPDPSQPAGLRGRPVPPRTGRPSFRPCRPAHPGTADCVIGA